MAHARGGAVGQVTLHLRLTGAVGKVQAGLPSRSAHTYFGQALAVLRKALALHTRSCLWEHPL